MKLDIIYSFKVMEGMVKHAWKLDIFSSLPHVRGCASSKPSLPGPNSETCIGQSPRWISQQGALSRAEVNYDHSSPEGTYGCSYRHAILLVMLTCSWRGNLYDGL